MKKKLTTLLFVMLLMLPVSSAQAQEEQIAPEIVDTTIPVDAELRSTVEAWLGLNAPVDNPYWAITYVEASGMDDFYVSIAALDIASPGDSWRITDDNTVAWMGTVFVRDDGNVELYSAPQETQQTNGGMLASPVFDPGGGSYVRFPWESGGTMMYGPRGVHEAGGGGAYATGFLAVDFVGGDDMGSGVASPRVSAAVSGEVDYVCADDTTTLVRLHNDTVNDYYIYAHLIHNENLTMGHEFGAGSLIGTLKYGSFDDNCGWAEQKDNHYHLHFGFQASGNTMRMEGCILNTDSERWTCGTNTVAPGEYLAGGGGSGGGGTGGGDDGGIETDQPSFWDYMVFGAISIWDKVVVQNMPDHTAMQFTQVLTNSVKLGIKLARVMLYSNVNIGPLIAVVIFGFGVKAIFGVAEFFVFLLKALKTLVPTL